MKSYIDENEEPMSSCCGSPNPHSDYDICNTCKEHTAFQVTCQGCKGHGHIFVSEHQTEPCPNPNCDDGYIPIEE